MSFTPRKLGPPGVALPTIKPGDPIRARYLNKITSAVRNLQGVQRVSTDADFVQDPVQAAADYAPQAFVVVSEAANTILCTAVVGGASVTIAKPPNLQGGIGTRTVNGEVQVIIPSYTVAAPVGSTTVFAANVGEDNTGIAGVDWQDLNVNGRMWAEDT